MPINISLKQAEEIFTNRANGSFQGADAGKGGRCWLEGEFRLSELEALCVIIRNKAGEYAEGAEEEVKLTGEY